MAKQRCVTVLVIEDEEHVRAVLCLVLRELGCSVLEAANGEDGVRVYKENPQIDVVVCDFCMPGCNGYGVYSRIAHTLAQRMTRFILVSGGGVGEWPEQDFVAIRQTVGVEFVQKPYEVIPFCERIASRQYSDRL